MNAKQESRLKMYMNLRVFVRTYPEILATLPNCEEFLTTLDNAIVEIKSLSEQQRDVITNATNTKNKLRDAVITTAASTGAKVQAYARYADNATLLNNTKVTLSDLKTASDLNVVEQSQVLYDNIQTYLSSLAPYDLTKETQTAFLARITAFDEAIPLVKQAIIRQKSITSQLNKVFITANTAVESIDTVVEIVKLTQTTFYDEYQSARKVEDASSSIMVKGQVKDAGTGTGIEDATLVFYLADDLNTVVLKKQTAEKGGFLVKSLDEGVYSVTVSKIGYTSQTVKAVVTSDKLCELAILLLK